MAETKFAASVKISSKFVFLFLFVYISSSLGRENSFSLLICHWQWTVVGNKLSFQVGAMRPSTRWPWTCKHLSRHSTQLRGARLQTKLFNPPNPQMPRSLI